MTDTQLDVVRDELDRVRKQYTEARDGRDDLLATLRQIESGAGMFTARSLAHTAIETAMEQAEKG